LTREARIDAQPSALLSATALIVGCTATFSLAAAMADFLDAIAPEAIGLGLAAGALIFLLVSVGIGAVGIRTNPFHSTTTSLLLLAIILLGLRIILPFYPAISAFWIFAVCQALFFSTATSLFGVLDAIAPVATRELLYWRTTSILLFGFAVGGWLSLVGLAYSSFFPSATIICFLVWLSVLLFGILASRPVPWAPQLGQRASRGPPPVGSLAILRRRGSLVTLAAVTAFLSFALFTQAQLLFLYLFSTTFRFQLPQWISLIAFLFECGGTAGWLIFVSARFWLPRLGVWSLLIFYPSLLLAPLVWWVVVPRSPWAALTTMVFLFALFPSLFITSGRYVVTVLPTISTRGALLLIGGLAGASGAAIGALAWFGLQPYMPFPALVRTTATLDLVIIGLSIALSLSYRWHWFDRLRSPAWGFLLPTRPWRSQVPLDPTEIEGMLRSSDKTERELGLILAEHAAEPLRYLAAVEAAVVEMGTAAPLGHLMGYLDRLPTETLAQLMSSPSSTIRAFALGAALYGRQPINLQLLTSLMRDEHEWVRLLACLAGWRYGLEEPADVAWRSLTLPHIDHHSLIVTCGMIPLDMPPKGLQALKSLARLRDPQVRLHAIERLSVLMKSEGPPDLEAWEIAQKASESERVDLRAASTALLAKSRHGEAAHRLGELLLDPSASVALAAGRALALCGREGLPHALKALQSRSDQACRAALTTLVLLGKEGEKRLIDYVNEAQETALEASNLLGVATKGGERWLPLLAAINDRYFTLVGQYSCIAHLRGYPNIGFALQALAAYGPLWSEAATGILAHWIVAGPYLRRAVHLTQRREAVLANGGDLSPERIQRALARLIGSPEPWLAAGALWTWQNLYAQLPDLPPNAHPTLVAAHRELATGSGQSPESLSMHPILFLRSVPLFSGFSLDDLALLNRGFLREKIKAETVIFEEGAPGDRLYIVYRGAVDLFKRLPDGRQQIVATVSSGGHFGEVSMLEEAPRALTAITREETELFSLSREQFVYLVTEKPELLFPLTVILGRRVLENLQVQGRASSPSQIPSVSPTIEEPNQKRDLPHEA
jgi:hypothetical protein